MTTADSPVANELSKSQVSNVVPLILVHGGYPSYLKGALSRHAQQPAGKNYSSRRSQERISEWFGGGTPQDGGFLGGY
jgi:hypothetical protein